MIAKYGRRLLIVGGFLLLLLLAYSRIGAGRLLKVGIAYPTETKPQSKLWYAHGHWWAWLPDREGSCVWKRDDGHWLRVASLDRWLTDLPGHADVWADENTVCAVLVGRTQLAVARLSFDEGQSSYIAAGSVTWPIEPAPAVPGAFQSQLSDAAIECATITRDEAGQWWIAYDQAGCIWVRRSRDIQAKHWEEPWAVARDLDADDLCTVFTAADGVGVVWTDQNQDALLFRRHVNGRALNQWEPIETIDQGQHVANDHLNAAVAEDGTVYLATKTSRYIEGEPGLSLRIRHPDGKWQSVAYGKWSAQYTPTRPIVLLTPDESSLFLVHTSLDSSKWNSHSIVCRNADLPEAAPTEADHEVIARTLDMRSATGCKHRLPPDAPWIVLASDRLGNVYEGELRITGRSSSVSNSPRN